MGARLQSVVSGMMFENANLNVGGEVVDPVALVRTVILWATMH